MGELQTATNSSHMDLGAESRVGGFNQLMRIAGYQQLLTWNWLESHLDQHRGEKRVKLRLKRNLPLVYRNGRKD